MTWDGWHEDEWQPVRSITAMPFNRWKPVKSPQREQTRREHKSTKSRAGRRTVGLPDPMIKLLRHHRDEQDKQRTAAGSDWEDKGHVFASPVGSPLSPTTDYPSPGPR